MASNTYNYGITKVILTKSHKDLTLQLVETTSRMWAILLFRNNILEQSKCFMWLSEKIRRIVQLNARREFKKYKIKLMTDELDWFD